MALQFVIITVVLSAGTMAGFYARPNLFTPKVWALVDLSWIFLAVFGF
jgi:hypothetical protein